MTDQPDPRQFGYSQPDESEQRATRRAAPRAILRFVCDVRQGMAPWRRLSLNDLSPGGFRIARFGEVDPFQPVRIRIPGLQVLSANIAWQDNGAIGCAFIAPLHDAVFDHLVRSANAQ